MEREYLKHFYFSEGPPSERGEPAADGHHSGLDGNGLFGRETNELFYPV
jgi:hypothetical protein